MKTKTWKNVMFLVVAAAACGTLTPNALAQTCEGWTPALGETCVCSDIGPQQVTVCLSRDGGAPVEDTHFTVDFDCTGCNEAPEVELIASNDDWRVWAVEYDDSNPGTPANLGAVRGDGFGAFYQVTIAQPDDDPGAVDIGVIDLNPGGTGYSNLLGGIIAGDVTTLLRVRENSSDVGGLVTLVIQGSLEGTALFPNVSDLVITEGLGSLGRVDVQEITQGGQLVIGPDLSSCATGASAVSNGVFVDIIRRNGHLLFDGNLEVDVTIGEIEGGIFEVEGGVEDVDITINDLNRDIDDPMVLFGTDSGQTCDFYGDLDLNTALDPDAEITLNGELASGALIDLTSQAVRGFINLNGGGAGSVTTGAVLLEGVVTLGASGNAFSGSATFFSVISGGEVQTTGNTDVSGSITLTTSISSAVSISGDLTSSGEIVVGWDVYSSGEVLAMGELLGDVTVVGEFDGNICAKNLTPGGLLPPNIDIADFGPNGRICGGCTGADDCADLDQNGIRDDNCVWWVCASAFCEPTDTSDPSDMGGSYGACPADGFCNLHDANLAMACFSQTTTCDSINIDAGGSYGACPPDGLCNVHDANHALSCFSATNTCTCGLGLDGGSEPNIVGQTAVSVVPSHNVLLPGQTVAVRVFIDESLDALQSYQLHLGVSGGLSGHLELVDIAVEEREDGVFDAAEEEFGGVNIEKAQLIHGLQSGNVETADDVYLGTFTFLASNDVSGQFVIDLLHDEDAGDQTFFVPSFHDKIELVDITPAVVTVSAPPSDQ